jgi:hypothetical protein
MTTVHCRVEASFYKGGTAMRTLRILAAYVLTVSIAGWMLADRPTLAEDRDVTVINMLPGQVMFEFVGQVINVPNTTTSDQFGYLSFIRGVSPIFNGTPQNEATAKFTFFRATTTERVISNGPLRIVNRTGTLTFYVDPASTPDFSNPSTFQSGSPILVARMRQQVVSDTANGVFTVVNENLSRLQPRSQWAEISSCSASRGESSAPC